MTFASGGEPVKKAVPTVQLLTETVDFTLSGSSVSAEFIMSEEINPIDADQGQVGQVIQNLTINAVQAMPNGGVIKVRAKNVTVSDEDELPLPSESYVKISISDQGIGIPPGDQRRIFDPFFTTKQKGSGLGLATVYSIIRSHGGYITLESVLGSGTTFHVYLLASQADIDLSMKYDSALRQETGVILVMDDEEFVREYASDLLSEAGYEVQFAKDGLEVLEIYKKALNTKAPIDLVILDLTIPGGMGGEETINELLKIDPHVRAIVSSGYSNSPVLANYREHGFRGVVPKPFRPKEMLGIVGKVIHAKSGIQGEKG